MSCVQECAAVKFLKEDVGRKTCSQAVIMYKSTFRKPFVKEHISFINNLHGMATLALFPVTQA